MVSVPGVSEVGANGNVAVEERVAIEIADHVEAPVLPKAVRAELDAVDDAQPRGLDRRER